MPNMQPGDVVVLISVPATIFSGLPEEDQTAIRSVIGKPVKFSGITYGQAELEFRDGRGDEHTIWVDTDRIKPA
jgi:hypothetical protein